MTNLLVRLLIRDYQNTEDPAVRMAYGKTAGLVGIVTNLLLTAAKFTVGLLFGSIAVIADAVNNLTDSASSMVTMIGFKLASKPADEKHPYGHARIEYIAGLIVSILILVLGFELARSSFDQIFAPAPTDFNYAVLGVLAGSVLAKLWQSVFYRKMGRAIRSTTLKAAAVDSLNDVIATSVVLAGGAVTLVSGFNLDGYLGMAVAVFIMISGVRLIIETANPLLGLAPSALMVRRLRRIFDDCPDIIGYHDLRFHDYGEQTCFATVHFEVDHNRSLEESHAVIDRLERRVKAELGVELVVHLDPIATDDEKRNRLQEEIRNLLREISPQLSMHDFHAEWGDKTQITFDLVAPYGFFLHDEDLRAQVEEKIAALHPDYRAQIVVDHEAPPEEPA